MKLRHIHRYNIILHLHLQMMGSNLQKRRLDDQFDKSIVLCKKPFRSSTNEQHNVQDALYTEEPITVPANLSEPPKCAIFLSKTADLINETFENPNTDFSLIKQYTLWEEGNERFVIRLGLVHGTHYMGITKFWRWNKEDVDFKPTRHNIYLPMAVWEDFYKKCMDSSVKCQLYHTPRRTFFLDRKLFKGVEYVGVRCEEEGSFRKSIYMTIPVLHLFICHIWLLSRYLIL